MNKSFIAAALLAGTSIVSMSALAADRGDDDRDGSKPLTIAVFGDWPYNQNLLDNAPLLTKSVNADRSVSLVLHVGDIHSGSMPCTSAGILPPISTSNPGWNQSVYYQFQQFKAPVVYTPGDNEWTDCHKSKEKSSGDPLKELASVRSLFFAQPGRTLGGTAKQVLSQAHAFDSAYPTDAQFVENMMWEDSRVVFATLNLPGSNNDGLPWTGSFNNPVAQGREVQERTDADLRWLKAAFDKAEAHHARAVVIALQANMWDPEALVAGGDGLFNYTPFVKKLAELSLHFGKPVLLLNGDSHVYGADRPLADPSSATGLIHATASVPNLTRITVQGSTTAPAEWLRLSIDARQAEPFSWQNVPYCKDPLTSCQ
jgi:hypothetical protein